MYSIKITLLLLLIPITIFSQSKIEINLKYDFEEINDELPLFGQISTAVFDSDGSMYLADKSANKVYHFDSTGKFLKTFGGPGFGPGEFNSCESIAVNEKELLVYDFRGSKIVFFDKNSGKESKVIHLKGYGQSPLNKIAFLSNELLMLGFRFNSNDMVHIINPDGNVSKSFGQFIDFGSFQHSINGKQQLSFLHFSETKHGILIGLAAPNRLVKFDSKFKVVSKFESQDLPTPWETHMKMRPGLYETRFYSMGLHNLMVTPNTYLFNWIEFDDSGSMNFKNHLELRDLNDAQVLSSFEFEPKSQILAIKEIDQLGILLLLRDANYRYKVYSITIQ